MSLKTNIQINSKSSDCLWDCMWIIRSFTVHEFDYDDRPSHSYFIQKQTFLKSTVTHECWFCVVLCISVFIGC